jgi:hypothetical protein
MSWASWSQASHSHAAYVKSSSVISSHLRLKSHVFLSDFHTEILSIFVCRACISFYFLLSPYYNIWWKNTNHENFSLINFPNFVVTSSGCHSYFVFGRFLFQISGGSCFKSREVLVSNLGRFSFQMSGGSRFKSREVLVSNVGRFSFQISGGSCFKSREVLVSNLGRFLFQISGGSRFKSRFESRCLNRVSLFFSVTTGKCRDITLNEVTNPLFPRLSQFFFQPFYH